MKIVLVLMCFTHGPLEHIDAVYLLKPDDTCLEMMQSVSPVECPDGIEPFRWCGEWNPSAATLLVDEYIRRTLYKHGVEVQP